MTQRPKVIIWYYVYCGLLAAMYFLLIAVGVVVWLIPAEAMQAQGMEKDFSAALMVLVGFPFFIASVLPFFFAPRPWLWIYGIILIALGLTSCCLWPICIPLLIYWIKPEAQRFFGKPV